MIFAFETSKILLGTSTDFIFVSCSWCERVQTLNIFSMQMFQKIKIKVLAILVFGFFCFTSFLKENILFVFPFKGCFLSTISNFKNIFWLFIFSESLKFWWKKNCFVKMVQKFVSTGNQFVFAWTSSGEKPTTKFKPP